MIESNKIPEKGRIVFQFISEPGDVNFSGKVHGGSVMDWIDNVGYACACNWSETYCVTVYVGGIRFMRPIKIGAIVRVEAQIVYTGKTSMHIAVDVFSKDIRQGDFKKTSHCIIVFVAVDEEGKPTPVKKWEARTTKEKRLEGYAKQLIRLRKDIDEEMAPFIQ